MFNAHKIIPLMSAFADEGVWCVVGERGLAGLSDLMHPTFSFPIYRGVTR